MQAAAAVADGRAEALVSAGSTGPTLAGGTVSIKRLRGVFRPALAVLLPVPDGPVLLLDAGASVEVRPEHLVQFAYMGACLHGGVRGRRAAAASACCRSGRSRARAPRTCSRRTSGWPRARSNFTGNVEGFDLPRATVDVVVADGFTGNVALKVLEGTVEDRRRRDRRRDPLRRRCRASAGC